MASTLHPDSFTSRDYPTRGQPSIASVICSHTELVSLGIWLIIFMISDSLYPNTVSISVGVRVGTEHRSLPALPLFQSTIFGLISNS